MSEFQKFNALGATQSVSVTALGPAEMLSTGNIDDALMLVCQRGLSSTSNQALSLRALLHLRRGQWSEAASAIRQLHMQEPSVLAYKMAGDLAYLQCQYEPAEDAYRRALKLAPNNPELVHDYGVAIVGQGRVEESLEHFKRACDLAPDRADFHHHYAIMLVLGGHTREGWEEMEWRMQCQGVTGTYPMPERYWNGQDLTGKTIALRSEQGFGDTIMFARYVPVLREMGAAKIYFYCQPVMLDWLKAEYPYVHPWPNMAPPPLDIDYHANIMSLPRHFPGQYFTQPKRDEHFNEAARGIGICWFGSPTHKADHLRTVPIERFAALPEVTDEPFYCVAYGRFFEGQQKPPYLSYFVDDCWDWKQTADRVKRLKLVITVDTAIAHLAGHHGIPCWLLLPYVPDFRWGMGPGESTPWYESVRLYRQPKLFDWESVFLKVRDDLARLLPAGKREAVAPIPAAVAS